MSYNEKLNDMILRTRSILDKYNEDREKRGIANNIFTILDMERDEVMTHSIMLYTILKPGILRIGDRFLKLFLKNIGIHENYLNYNWLITREYSTSYGRIDLFFSTKGEYKRCIVLELKIDACDQPHQLKRYETYIKEKFTDYKIVYLNLFGKAPSPQSIDGIDIKNLLCINFKEHIVKWLDLCLQECITEKIEGSFILQYKLLIEKLIEENSMSQDIINLIHNSDDLKAVLELSNSANIIKGNVLFNIITALKKRFEHRGYKPDLEDVECAKEYYTKTNIQIPYLVYKVKEFTLEQNKKAYLCLEINEDSTLLYCWIIYIEKGKDKELYPYNSNEFEKKYKVEYDKCVNAIQGALGVEVRKNSYLSIYWQSIYNEKNQKYDLKHFDNCAELFDSYEDAAGKIANDLVVDIENVMDRLNDKMTSAGE